MTMLGDSPEPPSGLAMTTSFATDQFRVQSWASYAQDLTRRLGSDVGVMINLRNADAGFSLARTIAVTIDSETMARGANVYGMEFDPDFCNLNRKHYHWAGRVASLYDVMSSDEIKRSMILNEFARPSGLLNYLSYTVNVPGGRMIILSAHYRHEDESESRRELFSRHMPNIMREIRAAVEHETLVDQLGATQQVMDLINVAIFVIEANGRVVHCNHPAKVMLDSRKYFRLAGGRLEAASNADSERFNFVCRSVASQRVLHRNVELILKGNGASPLEATIAPLPLTTFIPQEGVARGGLSRLVIFARPIGVTFTGDVKSLARRFVDIYGISVAQARVVVGFSQGLSEKGVAGALSLSSETVRSHLKSATKRIRALTDSKESRKGLLVRLSERHSMGLSSVVRNSLISDLDAFK